jgi:putative ABC transport system permease protein
VFFLTYLRRELLRRMRQAIFIAAGLALGIGLVITVMAASSGVQKAQAQVLRGLYGIGTDLTVTRKPPPFNPSSGQGTRIRVGPGGAQVCQNGHCAAGAQKIDTLVGPAYGPLGAGTVAQIARLRDVTAAAGGLTLTDQQMTIPAQLGPGSLPASNSFGVDGVDLGHSRLGPLSDGSLTSGRILRAADAGADVAVVDSDYAAAGKLRVGSAITVAKRRFTIIGIVSQPQGSQPPDVYIPLARAQVLATSSGKSLRGQVNTIYVTAASAADIPLVQREIARLLPAATVTTPASLASQVTGSLASTARLATDLGRWLSVLVLVTAFVVACLLTMAAVARRVREFGTLKALGWRSGRIIAQVLGESTVIGLAGGAAGVALGFAGATVISKIAPPLSATVTTPTGQHFVRATPEGTQSSTPAVAHTVAVALAAPVTAGAVVLAVILALAGGLLAGTFGSWRIARLRPADALARVA